MKMADATPKTEYHKEVVRIIDAKDVPIKVHVTDASKMSPEDRLQLGGIQTGMVIQEIYMNSPVRIVNIYVKENSFSTYLEKRAPEIKITK